MMAKRAFFLLALALSGVAPAADVKGVRVWTGPDHTRAVFDISAEMDYQLFELDNPPRVVIDIKNARLKKSLKIDKNKDIKGLRYSLNPNQQLRIVLDLNEKLKPKSFLLKPTGDYGHRLVVDLNHQQQTVRRVVNDVQKKDRDVIIAVDAGHGGEDPGALGSNGAHEKNITLSIAQHLAREIDKQPCMKSLVIRSGDYCIPLRQRFKKARDNQADLFISIHADAFTDSRVHGASVYTLSQKGASSEAAAWLAQSENESDLIGGVKIEDKNDMLSQVIFDLSQNAAMEESHKAAKSVHGALKNVTKLHGTGLGKASFVVLKSPDVPSILIESGYISNPDDERKLQDAAFKSRLVSSIVEGIKEYFFQSPPPNTWIAANAKGLKHVVQKGETLSSIALKNNTSVNSIRAINNKQNNHIMVGEVLLIPTRS